MIADAVRSSCAYSGQVGRPSARAANARSRPPVSATSGRLNVRARRRALTRHRASATSRRIDLSSGACAACSNAPPRCAGPCGAVPMPNARPHVPEPGHRRPRDRDGWSCSPSLPYIRHTTRRWGQSTKVCSAGRRRGNGAEGIRTRGEPKKIAIFLTSRVPQGIAVDS